jgi:peptide/nickel transport system substrate-binding protein
MEAPDDLTVVFTLSAVLPHFDVNFTNRLAFIASPTAIDELGADYSRNPVGAGPFMLEEWVIDDHLTLVRNPDYWNAPLPMLDSITFRPIPDNQQRINVLTAGEAELTYATDGTTIDALTDAGFTYSTVALNGGEGLVINTSRPPFDDPELRRALAHAINLDDFNNAVYDGHANQGNTLFSPDSPFFDPAAEPPSYDPDEAARIFDEYEAANGAPLAFRYNSFQSASSQAVGQFLQAVLGEYGVEVSIEVGDTSTAAGKVFAGDYDVSNWGLNLGCEPEPQLSQFFTGGLDSNLSRISDPAFDAALAAGATVTDQDERIAAYADVQSLYYELMPFVLLNLPNEGVLSAPGVGGIRLSSNGVLLTDELTAP